jgi:hypothetical protein
LTAHSQPAKKAAPATAKAHPARPASAYGSGSGSASGTGTAPISVPISASASAARVLAAGGSVSAASRALNYNHRAHNYNQAAGGSVSAASRALAKEKSEHLAKAPSKPKPWNAVPNQADKEAAAAKRGSTGARPASAGAALRTAPPSSSAAARAAKAKVAATAKPVVAKAETHPALDAADPVAQQAALNAAMLATAFASECALGDTHIRQSSLGIVLRRAQVCNHVWNHTL